MCDKREKAAVLRGFDMSVADVGDQMHLRHPLLSFKGDPSTLYVARRFNWRNSPEALVVADPSEASELATLLPDGHGRPMASGEGAVVAGAGFVRAAADAGVQLDGPELSFAKAHESGCWISAATQSVFAALESRLVDEAQATFDEALGDAARRGHSLSERGNAALLIVCRCGPLRREDLAVRQLAGVGKTAIRVCIKGCSCDLSWSWGRGGLTSTGKWSGALSLRRRRCKAKRQNAQPERDSGPRRGAKPRTASAVGAGANAHESCANSVSSNRT